MAKFDIVPQGPDDFKRLLDTDCIKPAYSLWYCLKQATGKDDPILLSDNNGRSVKIRRDEVGEQWFKKVRTLDAFKPLRIEYGKGSARTTNAGFQVEEVVLSALQRHGTGLASIAYSQLCDAVFDQVVRGRKVLEIRPKSKTGKVEQRPLQLDHRGWVRLGGHGTDAATRAGDIEIVGDGWTEYISVKTGTHHSFMNIGLDKAIPVSDFDERRLSQDLGRVLFRTLGLDEEHFFEVFRTYLQRRDRGDYLGGRGSFVEEEVAPCMDRLRELVRPALGNGYWMLHTTLTDPQSFSLVRMGEEEISRYLDISRVVVRYPRIGSSKKVGVRLYVPRLPHINYLEFSLRNKESEVWPRHCVFCAYLHSATKRSKITIEECLQ